MTVADPAIVFIVLLLIGVAAGLIFDRVIRPGWFSQLVNPRRRMVTVCLIGVAGSFVGYHLAVLLGLSGAGALVPFIVAAVGALALIYLWRTIS